MPDSLSQVESTLKGAATTIAAIFGVSAGPTAIIGILGDAVFRAIRLGRAIRAEQERANASLATVIKARGILRTPIIVDITPMQVRNFYRNEANLNIFKPLRAQFNAEINEFVSSDGNPSEATFDILEAAMQLVPQVHQDLKFDDAMLDALLGVWLNPVKPDFYGMVISYLTLCPRLGFSYADHYKRMEDFWKDRIVQEVAGINQAQLQAQTSLNQKIREIIRDTIFGSEGFLNDILKLSKEFKKLDIDKQIEALNKQSASLDQENALPGTTPERKTAIVKEKAVIAKEVEALNKWKIRIG